MKNLLALFTKREKAGLGTKTRKLRLEDLERREMLSVTPYSSGTLYPEFNKIAAAYPDLTFDASVKVVEISGDDLNGTTLQNTFSAADGPCLFVLRTDSAAPTEVNLDAALNLSPTNDFYVVAWGDSQNNPGVVFNARQNDRVLYVNASQNFECANLTFTNGKTADNGGGVYVDEEPGDYLFVDCYFTNNECDYQGGAVYYSGNIYYAGSIVFNDCSFIGNNGAWSSVFDNQDDTSGTSSVEWTNPKTEFNRCVISNNETVYSAIVCCCDFSMNNCVVTDNVATDDDYGCTFWLVAYEESTFTNCTIANNSAGNYGMCYLNYGAIAFVNSIVVNNTPKEIKTGINWTEVDAVNTISDFAAWDSASNCLTYTNSTPLFVDAGAQDYRLVEDSPCVDAGDNSKAVGNTDAAGKTRIVNDVVDMGAFEYGADKPTPTFGGFHAIVTSEEDGPVDHSDDFDAEGNAVNITLREAFDYVGKSFDVSRYRGDYQKAIDCFVVDAAAGPGVYDENSRVYLSGTYDTVYFSENVETIKLYDQLVITQDCTIDGEIPGADEFVTLNCKKRTRAFFVEETHNGVAVKNLNVINGAGVSGVNAGEDDPYEEYAGYGGAICNRGALTLEAVALDSCAADYGGAIFNDAQCIVVDSALESNTAKLGGAVYNRAGATLDLSESTFRDCVAKSDSNGKFGSGGAIYNSTSVSSIGVVILNEVRFNSNNASKYGGAVANYGALSDEGSTYTLNMAGYGGAIMNAGMAEVADDSFRFNVAANGKDAADLSDFTFCNDGGYGGAIYSANNKTLDAIAGLVIAGSTLFQSNQALLAGGAIDVASGDICFMMETGSEFKFKQNFSPAIGGAIVLGGPDVSFTYFDEVKASDVFLFAFNESNYAPTVAAAVSTEDAKRVAEGFGFDYAHLTTDQFDTFERYSDIPNGSLSFDYLASLADNYEESATEFVVSYGQTSITIGPGQSVSFDELGVPASGPFKISFAPQGVTLPYEIVVNRSTGNQVAFRRIALPGHDAAAFSFTSYAKSFDSWSILWGDGQSFRGEGLSTTTVFSHMYDEPGEYKIALTVNFSDGTSENYSFLFNNASGHKDWTIDVADSLLDDVFADEALLNDLTFF